MSVTEIGALQGRYTRLVDRFKSAWTYHQVAGGAFRSLLFLPLPYQYDFQKLYDDLKAANPAQARGGGAAADAIERCERELDSVSRLLLRADETVTPPVLRRFFEKLKKQDEGLLHQLIKFYFYASAVEGDRRDKIDFLLTRIGEQFFTERGEYWSGEQEELRETIANLVSVANVAPPPQEEVSKIVRVIRNMRDDIQHAERFEELAERNLLRNTRTFKHRIGDLYFQPDVLLAIIELNVATRNRFVRLYQEEEHRILDDADKLMAHGDALARNFGSASPDLAQEISKFRDFKRRFDDARADSNIKYGVVTGLKSSIGNILAQLDRGLEPSQSKNAAPPPELELTSPARVEALAERFGSDEVLLEYLRRIAEAIDSIDPTSSAERMIEEPPLRDLRLEWWEVTSYWKLFGARSRESDEEDESLWLLYLRAAALRVKADEEATLLATTLAARIAAENDLLERARRTLDWSKALDATFTTRLQASYKSQEIVRHLYRSRFRLLRTFSGLWLIYDRQV